MKPFSVKELVARALHYSGNRSFKPFVTVNCSALAESLLESELFGHVRGAITGAIKDKQGRFQAADGGTILLDEIGDISPMIQLKLLRVVQEKEVEGISSEVLGLFMNYPWPGKVREPEHAIEHGFVLCCNGAITLQHLP